MHDAMATTLFGSRLRAKAVGWLFGHPDEEFYVSEIASGVGEPVSNLSIELRKLAATGLLESRREGVQKYYRASRGCPIFGELLGIAVKTSGVAETVAGALSGLTGVEVAFIYGSIASGEAVAASDVDIMIIGDVRFAEVVAALEGARERIGRSVTPRVYSAGDFRRRLESGGAFFGEVVRSEKIFLVGDEAALQSMTGKTALETETP